ncbi:MAG: chorismate mutase [Actinomycetota bacterium]|nr:chorismate mutase [Actinomycetota bacterium]
MDPDYDKKISKYRDEINRIDKGIVEYLNERAKVVLAIKKLKKKNNLPLYDARREEELLNNITKYNKGPLYNDNIIQIFESILRNVQILERGEEL